MDFYFYENDNYENRPVDCFVERVVFSDKQKLEYELQRYEMPWRSVYLATDEYLYAFSDSDTRRDIFMTLFITDFETGESKKIKVENDNQLVDIDILSEGSSGNANFKGKIKSSGESVSGYITPNGVYYFENNSLDYDSVIISPVN